MWAIKHPEQKKREAETAEESSLLELGEALVKENIIRRYKTKTSIHTGTRKFILKLFPELEEKTEEPSATKECTSGRCYVIHKSIAKPGRFAAAAKSIYVQYIRLNR